MKINNFYTSVACNQGPESADWNVNGLIVFAANNAVVIMNPWFNESCKIVQTYVKHSKKVNTVKWIKTSNAENDVDIEKIISGSDDGTAIIWNTENKDLPICNILQGHEGGVNVVEALCRGENIIAVTGSTDKTIKLWDFNKIHQKSECFQTITLAQKGFCFALKLIVLASTDQICLFSSVDDNIYLMSEQIVNNIRQFVKVHEFIGHEDWIRSIDCIHFGVNDLFLASGSQDTFIRLWKISKLDNNLEMKEKSPMILHTLLNDIHVEEKIIEIVSPDGSDNKGKVQKFSITLESVLQGHEGWIYGVHWNKMNNNISLLSSSIDKTLIIWTPNEQDGVWMEKLRVGDVGGSSLGFFGGKFSSNGKAILGHGYQGSFHIWKCETESDENLWEPQVIVGGHFDDVRDLCWEPLGQFLITVSADQTTRVHAPWNTSKRSDVELTWHEIARPQVHGHNIQCITMLSRYKFASGAEEKVIRIFDAPGNFVENFRRICGIHDDFEGDKLLKSSAAKGACVPSLGLSNKPVYNLCEEIHEKHVKDEYPEVYFVPIVLSSPPLEETLMQNTLWPETQKLYGHGFEIFSLCASSDGKLLASSCKATSSEHAQIIIWDTVSWRQLQKLSSHQLTITQMKFSPDNKYLLSVSRDRRWTLFENTSSTEINVKNVNFEIASTTDKTNGIHNRIIWSCDWSHDAKLFGTVSRDGLVVLWYKTNVMSNTSLKDWSQLSIMQFKKKSITAIAFAPLHVNEENKEYLLALGLETGIVLLYTFSNNIWNEKFVLAQQYAHHSVVRKLQFRPFGEDVVLASCGKDNFVRIYKINF